MLYYDLGKDITAFTTDRTVGRNPSILCPLLGVSSNRFARPHQVHTDRIYQIDEEFLALPKEKQTELLDGVDAVISNVPDVVLGISTADCIPVLVYDAEHHAAAAIHAGWKGTVLRIVEKAMDAMTQAFGTEPAQCTAVIGPGISQQSFEVGQEVVDRFKEAGFKMDDVTVWLPNTKEGELPKEKPHIDLKEINRRQLLDKGVQKEKIMVSQIDTFADERYFSARREQKGSEKCGRILTGFVLKNRI